MHLLEQYALACGAKISEPFIYETFFPLSFGKYIVLAKEHLFPSRNYLYWQSVVDLLSPILKKHDINIIQVSGPKDKSLNEVMQIQSQDFNQLSYIIRNCELFLSIDNPLVHIASAHNKKIVSIYSDSEPSYTGPYWGDKENQLLIKSEKNGRKASHDANENPKTINNIKPEEIANSVLSLLGFSERINIKTLFIGDNYNSENVFGFLCNQIIISNEFIPDIRLDLFFDETNLPMQLSKQKCIITTNKPISKKILLDFKANISKIIYLISENDDPSFVKFLFDNGFAFDCVTRLNGEEIKKKKINYYRYCSISSHLQTDREKSFLNSIKDKPNQNIEFKTNYIISSNDKSYLSEQHLKENEETEDFNNFAKIKNSDLFFSDIKNMWIVENLFS